MCEQHASLSRRTVLRTAAAAGLGVVTTVASPTTFAAAAGRTSSQTITGSFGPLGAPDWHYLPIEVPKGVGAIEVSYDYDRTGYDLPNNAGGNVLDIGIFDSSGHDLGATEGFRGWSGGARSSFRITASEATPGYLAGPIDPGTWHVVLGPYAVAPTGMNWSVTVTLTYGERGPAFVPAPAPLRVEGKRAGWYRGDLHVHSVHSDGRRTLAEVAATAKAAGLDFIASTEHNTSSAGLDWGRHAPADLLVVNGEEVTTREGHWLAVGIPPGAWIDWRYRNADAQFPRFAQQVRSLGGLVVAAHPFSPFSGTTWSFGYADVDAVEVWNGPWTGDDQVSVLAWHAQLVQGLRLAAVGSSDTHTVANVMGLPQTVVRVARLSAGEVVAAVREGRSWIAESATVGLSFTASTIGGRFDIGDEVPGAGLVTVRLEATGVPGTVAVLWAATGPVALGQADASGRVAVSATVLPALARFVRAEVRRPGATVEPDITKGVPGGPMVALTNPIWLG